MDDGRVLPSKPFCWPRKPGYFASRAPGEEHLSGLTPGLLFPGAPTQSSARGVGRSLLTPLERGWACSLALAPGANGGRTTVPGQRGLTQTQNLWARLACCQTCREHSVRWRLPVVGTCPLPGPPACPWAACRPPAPSFLQDEWIPAPELLLARFWVLVRCFPGPLRAGCPSLISR